jgi:hypothetical protein
MKVVANPMISASRTKPIQTSMAGLFFITAVLQQQPGRQTSSSAHLRPEGRDAFAAG